MAMPKGGFIISLPMGLTIWERWWTTRPMMKMGSFIRCRLAIWGVSGGIGFMVRGSKLVKSTALKDSMRIV